MSESGDWYCRNCGYITSARVTHSETCDQCHIPVEWHDAEQQDELTTLRAKVAELEAERDAAYESIVVRVYESDDNPCNDCSHFIWGPGGPDPCECKILNGDGDYTDCPGFPEEVLPTPPEDKSDG